LASYPEHWGTLASALQDNDATPSIQDFGHNLLRHISLQMLIQVPEFSNSTHTHPNSTEWMQYNQEKVD
jgi:hypothetical protein